VLSAATILMIYAGWISFAFSYLAITIPLQIAGYIFVVIIDNVQSNRLAGSLNKALGQFHDKYQSD
jgi:hypothetical protein